MDFIPLSILVIDKSSTTSQLLISLLSQHETVLYINKAENFHEATHEIIDKDVNSIFIDPYSFGLDKASSFIFELRKRHPSVVFVLFTNVAQAERNSKEFYRGERSRFAHYYKLDKLTSIESFKEESVAMLSALQSDLNGRMPEREQLKIKAKYYELSNAADRVNPADSKASKNEIKLKSVFVSYRFAEEEYINGLTDYLTENGFHVITGKSANIYIGKYVIERIKESTYFLCLMTRDEEKVNGKFTTSTWLLEEKGVALALNKPIVLMIEDGVEDIGGLQGDWQRIHFAPKGFLLAVSKAIKQLKSYSGEN
jgi:hypothetical protein